MKKILSLSWIVFASTAAFAAPVSDLKTEILEHPVVTAVEQLLNAKYSNTCTAPTANDVKIGCTGALPPSPEPMVLDVPCFFWLTIACNGGSAKIMGEQQRLHMINVPGGQVKVSPKIVISKISLD